MSQVGLFISYNKKDRAIANALVDAITSLSPDLHPFIDHSGLEASDEYELKISKSIQQAHWFIMVCTSPTKDMSWCFYEAGQFRAKLEITDEAEAIRDRLCYIYDDQRPSQLSRYQGTLVATADRAGTGLNLDSDDSLAHENTELFSLFQSLLTRSRSEPLRDLNDQNVRKLMRAGVRNVTCAVVQGGVDTILQETVYQPRISFTIASNRKDLPVGLTADTRIESEQDALTSLFGISGNTTTWGTIKGRATELNGGRFLPIWVPDIEKGAREIANGLVPQQTTFLFVGQKGEFYRPIFARCELLRSKAKRTYLVFVPSRDRRFNVGQRTSLLLSALILSVRFRQRVLPLVGDLARLQPSTERVDQKKAEILQRLRAEIVYVEAEAVEFGMQMPKDEHEEPPLLSALRSEEAHTFMCDQVARWSEQRRKIFEKIDEAESRDSDKIWSEAATATITGLDGMMSVNGKFIDLLCRELLEAERVEVSQPGGG